MRGPAAVAPEIVRRLHQPAAEMVLPDPIDDAPPRERMPRVREPTREGRPTFPLGRVGRQVEDGRSECQRREGAGDDESARMRDLPTGEEMDRPGLPAGGAGTGEGPGTAVDTAGVDEVRLGQRGDLRRQPLRLREQRGAPFAPRRISRSQQQFLAPRRQRRFLLRARAGRRQPVREVRFGPPLAGLDGIDCRDWLPEGDVVARAIGHLQLREGENVIVLPRREARGGHAHVSAGQAVVLAAAGGERREARIGEVGHERDVVADPGELHAGAELRVIADLDLKADGKPEAVPDAVEGVARGQKPDAVDLDGGAQVDLDPLHRVRVRGGRAVVAAAQVGPARGGLGQGAVEFGEGGVGGGAPRGLEGGERRRVGRPLRL